MTDNFSKFYSNLDDPAEHAYAATANNTGDQPYVSRAVYVGATGNLNVALASDTANTIVSFVAVPAGTTLPIRVRRLYSTTTANSVVMLY